MADVGMKLSPRIKGRRGCYLTLGHGPPLILLPSQLVGAECYRPTLKLLSLYFRVYAVELPGCGGGDRLPRPWDAEEYAHWVAAFLEAMSLERASFIGHSCSGAVLLALGAIHPERVDRLVLADTIGANPTGFLPRLLFGRAIDCWIELSLTMRGWSDVLSNAVIHTRNFIHQVHLSNRADLRHYAARVRAATLVAWGRRDHTIPLLAGETLRAVLPRGSLYVSPAGSHDWLIERADEFATVVREFLEVPKAYVSALAKARKAEK